MSHWSTRPSRATASVAALSTLSILFSFSKACANFEIFEHYGIRVDQKLATNLILHDKCILVLLNHGRLVTSLFQVICESSQVFCKYVPLFAKRWS